jgi:hypothetical protein
MLIPKLTALFPVGDHECCTATLWDSSCWLNGELGISGDKIPVVLNPPEILEYSLQRGLCHFHISFPWQPLSKIMSIYLEGF